MHLRCVTLSHSLSLCLSCSHCPHPNTPTSRLSTPICSHKPAVGAVSALFGLRQLPGVFPTGARLWLLFYGLSQGDPAPLGGLLLQQAAVPRRSGQGSATQQKTTGPKTWDRKGSVTSRPRQTRPVTGVFWVLRVGSYSHHTTEELMKGLRRGRSKALVLAAGTD